MRGAAGMAADTLVPVSPQGCGAERRGLVLQPVVHQALLQGLQAGECTRVPSPLSPTAVPGSERLCPLQNQEIAEQLLYMLSKSVTLEELALESSGLRWYGEGSLPHGGLVVLLDAQGTPCPSSCCFGAASPNS